MAEILEAPVQETKARSKESADLSSAIAQSVERGFGQTVRCIRVYGDHYRCNWWAKAGDDPVSGRIVRSRFLRATSTPDGLVIEDLTRT